MLSAGGPNGIGSRFRPAIVWVPRAERDLARPRSALGGHRVSGSSENDSRPGVFNLSHSGLISRFLAYPFPFRDWLP